MYSAYKLNKWKIRLKIKILALNKPVIHDRIGWHKSSEVFIKDKGDAKKENSRPDRDFPSAVLVFHQFHCEKAVKVYSEPHFYP